MAQVSFWSNSVAPQVPEDTSDTSSVSLGLKFYSDVAGTITGIRFYKGPHNTGTHTGTLWTGAGIQIASVTFSGESASGWQQANFSSPVSISANTTYVVSYLAPQGSYADDQGYAWTGLKATPLHVSGSAPGMYAYGSSANFPTNTWNSSNYWVDVVFATATSTTTTASISGTISGGGGATVTLSGPTNLTATANASGVFTFPGVANGTYTVVPSKSGLNFTPATKSVTVNGANVTGVDFAAVTANSFWSSAVTPGTAGVTNDSSSVTLGLKFYSDVPGSVTAIRFYKGPNNNGQHVVNLWNSSGASIANATASGETASGWQQVSFATPVNISANTTYVVSYLAPQGSYADDASYSWTTLSATPLHVSGSSPGVFAYGSAPAYPNGTYNGTNYWVDLVFIPASSSGGSTTGATYAISGTVTGAAATLTLSGSGSGTAQTNSAGAFTFPPVANGSYLVMPSQSGYSFTPSSTMVTVNGAAVTGVNFTATATPTPVAHSVTLSWTGSVSAGVAGYNVYRGSTSGGPYSLINGSLITGTGYVDSAVSSGQTYFYVTTAVDTGKVESGYSNQATAVVPTP